MLVSGSWRNRSKRLTSKNGVGKQRSSGFRRCQQRANDFDDLL